MTNRTARATEIIFRKKYGEFFSDENPKIQLVFKKQIIEFWSPWYFFFIKVKLQINSKLIYFSGRHCSISWSIRPALKFLLKSITANSFLCRARHWNHFKASNFHFCPRRLWIFLYFFHLVSTVITHSANLANLYLFVIECERSSKFEEHPKEQPIWRATKIQWKIFRIFSIATIKTLWINLFPETKLMN